MKGRVEHIQWALTHLEVLEVVLPYRVFAVSDNKRPIAGLCTNQEIHHSTIE